MNEKLKKLVILKGGSVKAALYLGVHRSTLHRWVKKEIPIPQWAKQLLERETK
jgi:DNA-binding transcriptional regulator YdaS (Cro superfamily)